MARPKQDLTNIFAKTALPEGYAPRTDREPITGDRPTPFSMETPDQVKPNKPLSVYLSSHDRARLDAAAASLGVSRHSLIQYAVLYFLAGYEKGDIKPELQQRPTLKTP